MENPPLQKSSPARPSASLLFCGEVETRADPPDTVSVGAGLRQSHIQRRHSRACPITFWESGNPESIGCLNFMDSPAVIGHAHKEGREKSLPDGGK